MLEILAIFWLAGANGRKAQSRGRKPQFYTGLTMGLWFGAELLGLLIGYSIFEEWPQAYLCGLAAAVVGAIISRIVASTCAPGEYKPYSDQPLPGAQKMEKPATLTILREKSFVGSMVGYSFRLNGRELGTLKNGGVLRAETEYRQNTLTAVDAYGNAAEPLVFAVAEGGAAHIHFKAGRFVDGAHQGILPLSSLDQKALAAGQAPDAAILPEGQAAPLIPANEDPSDPPKPSRCYFLLGGAALVMLVSGLVQSFASRNSAMGYLMFHSAISLRSALSSLMLGGGLFLLLSKKTKNRVIGAAAMLVEALLMSIFALYGDFTRPMPVGNVFTYPWFYALLRNNVIVAVLLILVGVIFTLTRSGGKKLALAAWIAAAVLLAGKLFFGRSYLYYGLFDIRSLSIIVNYLLSSVALVLASYYCRALTFMRGKRVELTTGARVWSIIVIVATAAASIGLSVAYPNRIDPVSLLILLVGLTSMILLTANRRIGYLIAVLAFGITALMNLQDVWIEVMGQGRFEGLGAALGSVINLSITWGLIRGSWNARPVPGLRREAGLAS